MDLRVAVVARRGAPSLAQCLAALRAAGAAPQVETVGADGAGQARNRALAACDRDVLALVEDDVIVDRGWLAALRAAWDAAGEDVAVIGGPLGTHFPTGRPSWLGPGLEASLGGVDLGPEPVDVDLAARTFHGANVSFRTAALRGAAGFWPARGHRDGRDWFSDEHHTQRALATHGWRGRYDPQLAAERLVAAPSAGALLRRRLRYGARLAAVGGGRAPRVAGRALAGGTLRALTARGRVARLDGAGRAAENLGALVGARLVQRDFEPAVRTTPFRPSVPPPAARRRRRRMAGGAVVLLYHRVAESAHDPLGLCVAPARFAEQVDVLAASRRIVPLADLVAHPQPDMVAITFDDGYHDNATVVAPTLAERGAPWTLFVSTGHVDRGAAYWWDEVVGLFAAATPRPELRVELPGGTRAWRTDTRERADRARDALLAVLQALDAVAIETAMATVRGWACAPPDRGKAMTVAQLVDVARAGATIGAHTRTHRGLAYATADEQRSEVASSRDDLAAWLGAAPTAFAYPFGAPGADLDETTVAVVRDAGFRVAVVNAPGLVTPGCDPLAIPRVAVPDIDGAAFTTWLDRARA